MPRLLLGVAITVLTISALVVAQLQPAVTVAVLAVGGAMQFVLLRWEGREASRLAVERLRRGSPWKILPPRHLEREPLPDWKDGDPCQAPWPGALFYAKTSGRGPVWVVEQGEDGHILARHIGFDDRVSRWVFVVVATHEALGLAAGDVDPDKLIAARMVRVVDIEHDGRRSAAWVLHGSALPSSKTPAGGWKDGGL